MNLKAFSIVCVLLFLAFLAASVVSQTIDAPTSDTSMAEPESGSVSTDANETVQTILACQVIDESGNYVLVEDITGTGDCLTVTADNVTIDGNSHTISGDGDSTAITADSVDNLVIEDTTITDFNTAIEVTDSNNVDIIDSTITEAVEGDAEAIHVEDSNDITIANNDIHISSTDENATAIILEGVEDANVSNNTIETNTVDDATTPDGIDISSTGDSTIIDINNSNSVEISDNNLAGASNEDSTAIELDSNSDNILIEENDINLSTEEGDNIAIDISDSTDSNTIFEDNTIVANDDVIIENNGTGSQIVDNVITIISDSLDTTEEVFEDDVECQNCSAVKISGNDSYTFETDRPHSFLITNHTVAEANRFLKTNQFTRSTTAYDRQLLIARIATRTSSIASSRQFPYDFAVRIRNNTNQPMTGIAITETIPKAVASAVEDIEFQSTPSKIVESDPVVQWVIPSLAPYKVATMHYTVARLADESIDGNAFQSFHDSIQIPGIELQSAPECTYDSDCRAVDFCVISTCQNGTCIHTPSSAPECQAESLPSKSQIPIDTRLNNQPVLILLLALIALLLLLLLIRRKNNRV